MKKIINAWFNNWNQPQLLTLMITVIIVTALAIIVYVNLKKTFKVDKAPNTIALISEQYVGFIDGIVEDTGGKNFRSVAPYAMTLITMLLIGNLLSLFGFDSISTSYSVPLTLGLVAWIGIYISGIFFNGLKWFVKFLKNPLDFVSIQTALISISFRNFGNAIGGTIILFLMYTITAYIWKWVPVPILNDINLFGAIITVPFRLYFDIFDTMIQAFIFTLLTLSYWSLEVDEESDQETKINKTNKTVEIDLAKSQI